MTPTGAQLTACNPPLGPVTCVSHARLHHPQSPLAVSRSRKPDACGEGAPWPKPSHDESSGPVPICRRSSFLPARLFLLKRDYPRPKMFFPRYRHCWLVLEQFRRLRGRGTGHFVARAPVGLEVQL